MCRPNYLQFRSLVLMRPLRLSGIRMQIADYPSRFRMNLAVAIVFLLIGCTSTYENNMNQQADAEVETMYETQLDGQPILYLLESKIKLPPEKDWTAGQLSNHSFANESQQEAIIVYDRLTTDRNASLMELVKKRGAPGAVAIFGDWMNAGKQNRLALYEEKISFGVFNQNSKTLDEVKQSLSKKFGKDTAEKAHAAWVNVFSTWGESLKRNIPVAANCDSASGALQCAGN